jgi:hypothetical protein
VNGESVSTSHILQNPRVINERRMGAGPPTGTRKRGEFIADAAVAARTYSKRRLTAVVEVRPILTRHRRRSEQGDLRHQLIPRRVHNGREPAAGRTDGRCGQRLHEWAFGADERDRPSPRLRSSSRTARSAIHPTAASTRGRIHVGSRAGD